AQLPAVPATLSLQSQAATGPSGEHHPPSIPCPSRVGDFSLFSLLLFKCLSSRLWGQPYYTTNRPAKDVERAWPSLGVVRATRMLVRMCQYQPKHACVWSQLNS